MYIELEETSGLKVHLNSDQITFLREGTDYVQIHFVSGEYISVKGSAEKILSNMRGEAKITRALER